MARVLKIRMSGVHAADLFQQPRTGRLSIAYASTWLARPGAAPLSVRMPLGTRRFDDRIAAPFIAGLLPDSKLHRRLIGETLGVSPDNDFAMLGEIGRECAGAISIVGADEPDAPEGLVVPSYEAMEEADVARMIRELPKRPLMMDGSDEVRLSLAGVNDKAAVIQVDGKVALPTRDTPSTHILKVDIADLPDSVRTEHFCLRLAALCGIHTPRSKVLLAEGIPYMLVSRYDRRMAVHADGPRLSRTHQEDFGQAFGVAPDFKYERDGGPGWKDCFDILDRHVRDVDSRRRLLDAAILQWLIGNPDAHAKNYSLLHAPGRTTLAPIYDLNNAAAFRDRFKAVRPRMAMSVGGTFDPGALDARAWDRFAIACGFRPQAVRERLLALASTMPDHAVALEREYRGTEAWSERLAIAVDDVATRCAGVPSMMGAKSVPPSEPAMEQAAAISSAV